MLLHLYNVVRHTVFGFCVEISLKIPPVHFLFRVSEATKIIGRSFCMRSLASEHRLQV